MYISNSSNIFSTSLDEIKVIKNLNILYILYGRVIVMEHPTATDHVFSFESSSLILHGTFRDLSISS